MKLVADISAWQTHDPEDWSIRRPYNLDQFAASVDAAWVRWSDWKGYLRWGPDPDHRLIIDTLRDRGKLVGSYLFCRPGMSTPQQQISTWAAETPTLTYPPMLDLEDNGGLGGVVLSRWVDYALADMTVRFGRIPWLYTQASKIDLWKLSKPTTPHLLILSHYKWGYTEFPWASRSTWPNTLSTGPDMPEQWDHWDAWQFTSSAEVPGMPGLIDVSWVTDDAHAQSGTDPGGSMNDMEKDVLRSLGVKI